MAVPLESCSACCLSRQNLAVKEGSRQNLAVKEGSRQNLAGRRSCGKILPAGADEPNQVKIYRGLVLHSAGIYPLCFLLTNLDLPTLSDRVVRSVPLHRQGWSIAVQ